MKPNYGRHGAALLLGVCLCASACAQYVWIDAKNIRHYSDRPPPPEIAKNRILKAPPGSMPPQAGDTATGGPAAAGPAAADKPPTDRSTAPPTLADKNAEFQKRRTEAAEKEKKSAEAAENEKERRAMCDSARSNAMTLQSGERLNRTDASGERTAMSDEQRATELAQARKTLSECK
jgi:type IV secretory pathway VirB10-like protein